jgi:hypothetical protein
MKKCQFLFSLLEHQKISLLSIHLKKKKMKKIILIILIYYYIITCYAGDVKGGSCSGSSVHIPVLSNKILVNGGYSIDGLKKKKKLKINKK